MSMSCPVFDSAAGVLQHREVDVDVEVDRDRFAVLGGGLELVPADGLNCLLIEAHAYALYHPDVRWTAVLPDLKIDANRS